MKTKFLFFISIISLWGFFSIPQASAADDIPRISLQNAILIAEGAMTKEGFDKTKYYISAVTYSRADLGYFWDFTFKPMANAYDRNYIHVRVYMNSETEVLEQSGRRRRR